MVDGYMPDLYVIVFMELGTKALNLTVGSARTYTKKVYAKMGARGHADLVLFVQRSVLQIA